MFDEGYVALVPACLPGRFAVGLVEFGHVAYEEVIAPRTHPVRFQCRIPDLIEPRTPGRRDRQAEFAAPNCARRLDV